MAFVFPLPEIGEGIVEGEVVAWKVGVGDAVRVDQPLCDIMTDKATVEISSPRAGTVTTLFGKPGDIIKVHAPLVELDEGGAAKAAPAAAPAHAHAAAAPTPVAAAPIATASGDTRAAPAVRRHAREEGLDVHAIAGTGAKGRVTHADVDAAVKGAPAMPLAKVPVALPQVRASAGDTRVKIIGLRRKIAEQMRKSRQTAAHFTYVEEVDCTRLVEFRERLKGRAQKAGVKLSFLPFFAKACSIAFREYPNVNAVMDEDKGELVVRGDHNIGFAVDTASGLFVPVVKNVEQKTILQIAAELADLADRTRAGKARADELTGGTFTITGVGNIGGVLATPILNIPEVGILGTNAIRDQAVVRDGQIVIRKMMMLSNSFDHRIIDGAVGARFTAVVKELIEAPESLVLELA